MIRFDEYAIPADMSEGDAIDFFRLTGKAAGLRSHIARRNRSGQCAKLASAALDAAKRESRAILARYA